MDEPEIEYTEQTQGTDEKLKSLAFLYTSTEKGNNSGIRFMMSLDDAETFCSDKRTQGVLHGTRWAYFFTSVYNFLHAHDCYGDNAHSSARVHKGYLNLKGCTEDKGTFDHIIEDLRLKKINISEFGKTLEPLGIEILT
jgi:hypothetical protein